MAACGVSPEPPAHHLAKAARFARAAHTLLGAGLAEQATSAIYDTAFHATSALLASGGLEARTHEGVRRLLALHFVKDGPLPAHAARDLGRLLSDRLLADDAVAGEIDAAAAADAGRLAIDLVRAILPVLVARDPATEAVAAGLRGELDQLAQAVG